jgi:lipopolysaccharide transport system ATP-binding protein
MSSEVDIRVRSLSKVYRIYDKPEHRLIQMATLGRIRPFKEFSALRDVSLDVRRGETVGIIGRNGCGKSTLLQIICGTLQPTTGVVEVSGRIAALLELGAGFNGEFTGRENVYMNGAILGLSREEMDARFEGIANFAGIGDFIERPVKTYSSGMFLRLAFAVAAAVEPDILVVDEALAVGDEAFVRKCFARIDAIKERGGTILFVSHAAQTIVQLCDRAVLLDGGEKLLDGEPKRVVSQYQRLVNLTGAEANAVRESIRAMVDADLEAPDAPALPSADEQPSRLLAVSPPSTDDSWFDPALNSQSMVEYESKGARISNLRIEATGGRQVNVLRLGETYIVAYDVAFWAHAQHVVCGFQAKSLSGLELAGANNLYIRPAQIDQVFPGDIYSIRYEFRCRYLPGTLLLDVGVMGTQGDENHFLHRILDAAMFRVAPEVQLMDHGLFSLECHLAISRLADGTAGVAPALNSLPSVLQG